MKNRIKKTLFFSYGSYAMKKESGSKRIYPPIPHVEYWIIRRIKPDNVFFIQFYALALDMDIILYIWSCATYYLA